MSGGGKVIACDSLTGLHLGFGLNVSSDEYKSDVDVLGTAEYEDGAGDKWTFTGPRYTVEKADTGGGWISNEDTINDEKYQVRYKASSSEDGLPTIIIEDNDGDAIQATPMQIAYKYHDDYLPPAWVVKDTNFTCLGIVLDKSASKVSLSQVPVHTFKGRLTATLIDAIILHKDSVEKTIGTLYQEKGGNLDDFECINDIKYPNLQEAFVKYNNSLNAERIYMESFQRFNGKTVKCGGELKASYYHNIVNNVYVGFDISGTIMSTAKKSSKVNALRGSIMDGIHGSTSHNYTISYQSESGEKKYVNYNGETKEISNGEGYSNDPEKFFYEREMGIFVIPERTYIIEQETEGVQAADTTAFKAANPGYTVVEEPLKNLSQYFQVSNEKGGDVTFEKNKFNSRAAVVLGAQYKGWFAGIRGGISYNQGKVHAKDITGTSTEDVSFASPFVGVHLMKSINMKGLEKGHIYLTADVNVENKQNLKMKGVKNFRHNAVNVSIGMTWKIK